jgi:2-keto-3-deoxy-L-rhamnonate aldolase RhmA
MKETSPKQATLARYRARQRLIGTSFDLGSPAVVEAAAAAPLDWCVLDWEHALWNDVNLPSAIQVLAQSPMLCIVRVPCVPGPWIKKALDWGADGVLVPNIRNLAEARLCVEDAKYAPIGRRGVGPYRPSKFYTDVHSIVRSANENTLLWLMIEKASLVEELEEVCRLPGVDGFVVGRNDLAQSTGRAYADCSAETDALAEKAMAICVAAGKPVGCFSGDPAEVLRWAERGVNLLTVGDDAQFIRDGMALVAAQLSSAGVKAARKEY